MGIELEWVGGTVGREEQWGKGGSGERGTGWDSGERPGRQWGGGGQLGVSKGVRGAPVIAILRG